MAAALKAKTTPDEFCDDGVTRRLNKSRTYGTVYADGFEETKFVQDNVCYRGDGTPVGYVPAAHRGLTPVEPTKEELLDENEKLRRQIETMMKRLDALERDKATPAEPAPVPAAKAPKPAARV